MKTTRRNKKSRRVMKNERKHWGSVRQILSFAFLLSFLRDYCINTSLHGLRYIAEDDRHWTERLIWTILCSMAVVGALFTSSNIWDRYQTSPTMTVLESTNFAIENLPFPAISICNLNHVRWDKALRFQEKYLPDADEMTLNAYTRLVGAMSQMNFGDFDKVNNYFGNSTEDAQRLDSLNVTFFMLEVMSTCEEFFVDKCWWRNLDFNCCSLFELQKSEYGFCYSFNSETSEFRTGKEDQYHKKCSNDDSRCMNPNERRPRRTSTSGMWSGLRITVNTFPDQVPSLVVNDSSPGVIVLVTSPYAFPMSGNDVAAGSSAQVSLSAQVTHATPQVRDLSPRRRGCLYNDEGEALGRPNYYHGNCVSQCHRDSTLKYCNCTAYFYPDEGILPICDVTGLLCLSKYNDVFNYEKPEADNPFFDDDQEGMMCTCAADCNRIEYTSEIYVTPLAETSRLSEDHILLDFHFKHAAMVKYRTDVVFGWLDLTVALGGIAGLFIGFSLLSGAELIYYFTFRLYSHWKTRTYRKPPPRIKVQQLPSFYPFQQNYLDVHKLEFLKESIPSKNRVIPQSYY